LKTAIFSNKSKRSHFQLRLLLIAVFFINGLIYIPRQAIVSDERNHLNYAVRFAKGHPEKVKPYDDASTMPVSALNTLPRVVQQIQNPGLQKSDEGVSDILMGRYITLVFAVITGIYIAVWAKELYGETAATFSLFLFVFCPNLNAHAGFFTTDAYAALFTIVPCYYFWNWHKQGGWKYLLYFSITLGIAQLTKQSLTNLIFIFVVLSVLLQLVKSTVLKRIGLKLVQLFVIIAVVLFVINAGFLFKQSFLPLEQYSFSSRTFNNLQSSLSFIGTVPLPLPSPYLYGLDLVKYMTELSPGDERVSFGNYILGNRKTEGSFWYYYFIILLFKSPMIPLAATFILLFKFRKFDRRFLENEFIIVAVIVYFFSFFNFLVARQVGMRHILIIYPLIYVLAGRVVTLFPANPGFKVLMGFAVLYSTSTFYYFFPNLVAYTNELIVDKKRAYLILGDSNLDWGQGRLVLEDYLKKNGDVKVPGSIPAAGKYIISASDFVGLTRDQSFAWMKKYRPVNHVYFSYLLFDISEKDIADRK
jgi:4-amino-4-deoxy-L-arabinose transferase-like glycosyltransferase